MADAAAAEALAIMVGAHERGEPWCPCTTSTAAMHGHLDCLRYAHEAGAPWCPCTTSFAAMKGHLDCLRYAHEAGAPWFSTTVTVAAGGGHLDCLRYAHEHGAPWTQYTAAFAASIGNMECLRYVHEAGAPWGLAATSFAAGGGHLDCLRYAHEAGAPWCTDTIRRAERWPLCMEYAMTHGCPVQEEYEYFDAVRAVRARITGAVQVQAAWRRLQRRRAERRLRASNVIADAYLRWTCRPGRGASYARVERSYTSVAQQCASKRHET